MVFALVLFIAGAVVVGWIFLWSQQQQPSSTRQLDMDELLRDVPLGSSHDAVLVSREPGQLVYANPSARIWLGMNGDEPNLEQIARLAHPADSFLELFALEGQSSFQLGERWIEASSHRIPSGSEMRTVVVMRELTANTSQPDILDLTKAMRVINEIGETINVRTGVNDVLQTLLSILGKAVAFDAAEICLWDNETHLLRQHGWIGDHAYVIALAEDGGLYREGEGITGWIARHRKPVLITNRTSPTAIRPKLSKNPYQSFVGVPLALSDRFMGTLELGSLKVNHFTQGDLALLQAVQVQVAISIFNAQLYHEQVRRVEAMASLQQTATYQQDVDTHRVYYSLTEHIAQLLGVEICGVLSYDSQRSVLTAQPSFYGLPDQLARSIVIQLTAGSQQADIWDNQQSWASEDIEDEPLLEAMGLTTVANLAALRNVLILPMWIGGERIGALLAGNRRGAGGFNPQDIQNMRVLAAQAAIVVENVRLYQREQQLETQVLALQEITHAIGALRHTGEFYSEITARIAKLMEIEMCGILLYDAAQDALIAQQPFFGIDDEIEYYRIDLPQGSVQRELWEDEEYWYTNNVKRDPLVFETELYTMAEAFGVEKTLIAGLFAGGRKLGVVQVSNKRNGSDFTENDARLLLIFATQAAAIIENANLFQQVRRSAEEADSLRRVAQLAGGVLRPEAMVMVLEEIAGLMDSASAWVSVLDEQLGTLTLQPRYVYGALLTGPIVQDMSGAPFSHTVSMSLQPYLSNDIKDDPNVLPGYRTLAEHFSIQRAVVVPLMVGEQRLGELGVANRRVNYVEDDTRQLAALGAQIAATIERLRLYEATGQNLTRRMEELDSISKVSNQLTVTLELDPVLEVIRTEAAKATKAEGSTIVLLKPQREWLLPDRPEMLRRIGAAEMMPDLTDIERAAILRGSDTVLVADYHGGTMTAEPPGTRSAIAAAFLYLDQIVGVIHLYHWQQKRFDERAAAFLLTMATKASLGFGNNVRAKEQLERSDRYRRRAEQLNRIFDLGQMVQSNVDSTTMLEAIAYSVQHSVGFDTVVILAADNTQKRLRRVSQAGMPLDAFERTKQHTLSLERFDDLRTKLEFRTGDSYLFPVEKAAQWYSDDLRALSTTYEGNRTLNMGGREAWRDGDMLLVMLVGAGGELLGVLSLDRPFDNLRPDRQTIEILEIFAHQAATMIENQRLYQAMTRGMEQEARLNAMVESVASTLDLEGILDAVARNAMSLISFNRMYAAVQDPEDDTFDVLELKLNAEGVFNVRHSKLVTLEETALERSYRDGTDHLYRAGDPEIAEYMDLSELYAQGEQLSLILPLTAGGVSLGAVHFGSMSGSATGFEEALPVLKRIMQIAGVSVQNARLFNQAVDLQVLNESVVESIQQGIVVLDSAMRILSVNEFMRRRFKWDENAISKNLMDYSDRMFADLEEDLQMVLHMGVPREKLAQEVANVSLPLDGEMIINFYSYPLRSAGGVRGIVLLIEDVTEAIRLERAARARERQLAVLAEVSSKITASLNREEVISLALREMERVLGYDAMTLWRHEGPYMTLEGANGVENAVVGHQIEIAGHQRLSRLLDSQRLYTIGTLRGFDPLPGEAGMQSWMGIPLVNQQNVVGLIMLAKREPNYYDVLQSEQAALAFANQVAVALANADLFEQTFARTHELGTLLEAAQSTALMLDLEQVFRTIAELMFNTLPIDECAVLIWDEVENVLDVQVDITTIGADDESSSRGKRYDVSQYPARARALRERRLVMIRHDDDAADAKEREEMAASHARVRLIVPLVLRDQAMGLIHMEQRNDRPVEISQQQMRLAQALGAQVAVAIENARLSSETAARVEESMIINDLTHAITSTIDIASIFQVVRAQLPSVTEADELYVALFVPEAQQITFPLAVRSDGSEFVIPSRPLGKDEVSFVIQGRRALSLGGDYFSPDDVRRSLSIQNMEGEVKSYLAVPMVAGDTVLGVLAVRDLSSHRAFGVNDQRILQTVGAQLGVAIQNARLFEQIRNFAADLNKKVQERTEELQQERDRIDTLYQITSELARTLDMERVIDRALGMVAKATGADDGTILLSNPITDQLYSSANLNFQPAVDDDGTVDEHPAGSLASWLIENDHSLVVDDLSAVDYWDLSIPGAAQFGSALAVLLETNEEIQGVMVLLKKQKQGFTEDHLRLVVAAANQVASTINNADLYQLIREQTEKLGTLLRAEQEDAEKNAAILEGIADGVILADAEGLIVQLNTAAERILDLPRDQVLGQSISKLTGIYGSHSNVWGRIISEWRINSPEMMGSEFLEEKVNLGERFVSIHLSPVYISDRFLGTVSVFRDITRDVEVDRAKSDFISNVSHEFRTPLTPIKGYVDLLLMGAGGDVTEAQASMLRTIKDNVDRLNVLVNDVLEISKVTSGREALRIEPVNLHELLPEIVNQLLERTEHSQKNFIVSVDVDRRVPVIEADSKKLMQIVNNLVDNAFNYTRAGGSIEVKVMIQPEDERRVLLRVKDTGIGIPEEFGERIWLRFERFEEHALELDVAGTGLGLPIVKELVELLGGQIWYESQLGVGSTFYVTLPIEQPSYLKNRTAVAVSGVGN